MTQRLALKSHNGGKNHSSPQAAECTIREKYNSKENTEATTTCPLLRHTRRLQRGGNYLSLSHTHTRSVQLTLYKSNNNALYLKYVPYVIYIHIWLFGIFTFLCFQSVGTDRDRFCDGALNEHWSTIVLLSVLVRTCIKVCNEHTHMYIEWAYYFEIEFSVFLSLSVSPAYCA